MLVLFWKNFWISCFLSIEFKNTEKMMFFTNFLIFKRYKYIFKFCSEQHKHISTMFLVCEFEVQSGEDNDIVWTLWILSEKLSQKTYVSLCQNNWVNENVWTSFKAYQVQWFAAYQRCKCDFTNVIQLLLDTSKATQCEAQVQNDNHLKKKSKLQQ